MFEIDPADAQEINKGRFEWMGEIVLGEWMPFTVLPKTTVTKHFIFESRWEDPVIQEVVDCTLEIRSGNREWQKVAKWTLCLSGAMWSELADVGTSISYHSDTRHVDEGCVPADLHNYTGTKGQIPQGGFRAGPSYLDYPKG
jgi:hypothetical protein